MPSESYKENKKNSPRAVERRAAAKLRDEQQQQQQQQQQAAASSPPVVRRLDSVFLSPGRSSVVRLPSGPGGGPVVGLKRPHSPAPVPQVIVDLTPPSPVLRGASSPVFVASSPVLRGSAPASEPKSPVHKRPRSISPAAHSGQQQQQQHVMSMPQFLEQQRQDPLRGLQLDPKTGLAVTLTRSPRTAGGAGVELTTHDLSGQTGASSLGNSRASGYAGSDDKAYLDQLLVAEGFRPFDQMSNEYVESCYERCSREFHILRLLQNPAMRNFLQAKLRGRRGKKDVDYFDCTPTSPAGKVNFSFQCGRCGTWCWSTQASRILACLNEPEDKAWMGAVTLKASSASNRPIFQGSAICDKYQSDEHCLHVDHVLLETGVQNVNRMGHHNGNYRCFCETPCIGPDVRRDQPGKKER